MTASTEGTSTALADMLKDLSVSDRRSELALTFDEWRTTGRVCLSNEGRANVGESYCSMRKPPGRTYSDQTASSTDDSLDDTDAWNVIGVEGEPARARVPFEIAQEMSSSLPSHRFMAVTSKVIHETSLNGRRRPLHPSSSAKVLRRELPTTRETPQRSKSLDDSDLFHKHGYSVTFSAGNPIRLARKSRRRRSMESTGSLAPVVEEINDSRWGSGASVAPTIPRRPRRASCIL